MTFVGCLISAIIELRDKKSRADVGEGKHERMTEGEEENTDR